MLLCVVLKRMLFCHAMLVMFCQHALCIVHISMGPGISGLVRSLAAAADDCWFALLVTCPSVA
jgi:hypothetical protein